MTPHDYILIYLAGALVQASADQAPLMLCEDDLHACADELAEAEVTLDKARRATELAEIVLKRGE